MPLQMMWASLKRYTGSIQKIFLLVATLVVVFNLFVIFMRADHNRDASGRPDPAQMQEARRIQLYALLDEKQDSKHDADTILSRKLSRWTLCLMSGELCTSNPAEAKDYRDGSLGSIAGKMLVMPLQHPPSSFYYWAQNTIENAGFVPKTYAAGIGFQALSSYQPIWKAFRNLSYMVIVVVIVVVGFMVMFGVGGGGKTAVTLESSLPRLVIALLAISFSYPLAGLFVDIMYVSMVMIMSYFGPLAGYTLRSQNTTIADILGGGKGSLLFDFLWGGVTAGGGGGGLIQIADSLYELLPRLVQDVINGIVSGFAIKLAMTFAKAAPGGQPRLILKPINWAIQQAGGLATKGVGALTAILTKIKGGGGTIGAEMWAGLIVLVVEFIAGLILTGFIIRLLLTIMLIFGMVFVFLKIFFIFIFVYVDIFLSIVTAPLILMLEAVPGRNSFINWMRGLLVNLAVFPLSIGIILLARIIFENSYSTEQVWAPPFVNVIQQQGSLQFIVGGVLLYSLPKIIKTFRSKLGGESLLGSLDLGIGALLVGATPFIKGGSTILGASGLGGALAKKVSEPFAKALRLPTKQIVELAPDQLKSLNQP